MNELELFHAEVSDQCSAEQARDLTDRIKLVLDGMWELVKAAYTSRAWAALGYATWDDYCTREFGTSRLKLPREERAEVIASLRESGFSTRAIAAATNLSVGTVHAAQPGVQNRTPAEEPSEIAPSGPSHPTPKPVPPPVKGLDGKQYQPTRADQSHAPTPSSPLPVLDDVLVGEVVPNGITEQPNLWGQAMGEVAREAAEQIAGKVAEFAEQAEQDAQLNATAGMQAINEQIRKERPYGLAAIDLEDAINGMPLDMDPRELAAHMPLTHRDAADLVPQALAWLSEFAQATAEWRNEGAA